MEEKRYDLVIVGSGPAGLSAAIYADRARLKTVTIEQNMVSGGQVINTYEVDNYPGLPGMNGFDLAMKFREHAEGLGASFVTDTVLSIEKEGKEKVVRCSQGSYWTKAVILAPGASHRKLGIPGEEEFSGKGVSYCATCDGAFYRNKTVAVIGGGDVAVEDAIFLARLCKKVYVIHRRDQLRAAKSLQETLFSLDNVEMLWNRAAVEIAGEASVKSLKTEDTKTKKESLLEVDGVFIAVGIMPLNEPFQGLVRQDEGGYIVAGEDGITSEPGIFVAGDARKKGLRQIVTAVADGANAVTSAEKYVSQWKFQEIG